MFLRRCMVLLLPLSVVFAATNDNLPKIVFLSPSKVVDRGGTAEFSCVVSHSSQYPVNWYKEVVDQERIALTAGNLLLVRDARYSLRAINSNLTLRLEDAVPEDAGLFTCEIAVSVGVKISKTRELKVLTEANIFNGTRTLSVPAGESINLDCYASGYPEPIVYWKRQDNRLLPTGGSVFPGNVLTLESFSEKDAATYFCVADNTIGSPSVRNVTVFLQNTRRA